MVNDAPIHVIGAGLAGSEAAWQIANAGVRVVIHEMRPVESTDAHQSADCAELVCSNSFRSDDAKANAVGLLHEEMRLAGSIIMRAADANKVPAGGALAVDREQFARAVTTALDNHPNIEVRREIIRGLPPADWDNVIVATGPLTAPSFAAALNELTGEDALAFFDAIAPIVYKESIDFSTAWFQSRYDKKGPGGDGADYINCPMNKDQYEKFITALLSAEYAEFKDWERSTPYFEGCLPIEIMAARGVETLRHGPMKPVGLTNPNSAEKPHAVVQLRQDNAMGTLYNMVGFQTKLKYGEQVRIFQMIPGLENARFARLGGIHRNTFLNSPVLLDSSLRLKARPQLRFAGQITGVEGYIESAAIGLLAGRFAAADHAGIESGRPPVTTALGALLDHITGGHSGAVVDGARTFQPMNINFGLFPPIDTPKTDPVSGARLRGKEKARAKKLAISRRALSELSNWLDTELDLNARHETRSALRTNPVQ